MSVLACRIITRDKQRVAEHGKFHGMNDSKERAARGKRNPSRCRDSTEGSRGGALARRKLGLVLSSGGARGAAHVGVLRALEDAGMAPDILVGASMGAQVGGSYAAGVPVTEMADYWQSSSFLRVMRTLLPTAPWFGWSSGREVTRVLTRFLGDRRLEDLRTPFVAVATDLESGLPVELSRGPMVDAIRASLSVPGLFTPVWIDGRLLIDGGVSNPLPIDVARAMGADVVVAVDVLVDPDEVELSGFPVLDRRSGALGFTRSMSVAVDSGDHRFRPSVFRVLFQMSTVFQKRLANLMIAAHPPDLLIRPDFSADPPCYSRVGGGIDAGEEAARAVISDIHRLLDEGS